MRTLAPNPSHIVTPRDSEMEAAADFIRWRSVASCMTCGGRGTFRWYVPGSRAEVDDYECSCEEQTVLHWWLSVRGVEHVKQGWGWADLSDVSQDALALATELNANPRSAIASSSGVVVTSGPGGGKTSFATLLLKRALMDGLSGRSISAIRMFEVFSNWRDQDAIAAMRKAIIRPDVLLIDDLGTEIIRDQVLPVVDDVLDSRASTGRWTIITSPLDQQALSSRYRHAAQVSILDMRAISSVGQSWHGEWRRRLAQESADGLSRPIVFG